MQVLRFEERDGAGHVLDIEPRGRRLEFRPMNLDDFRRCYLGDGQLDFVLENTKTAIAGPEHNDTDLTADVSFSLQRKGSTIDFAALLPGGWLPANVAQVDLFLPDSNIACNLGKFKTALEPPRLCDALDMGARQLNPMLPAIEGNKGRFPSLKEVETRAIEVFKKFERRFPGRALPLSTGQIIGAYGLVEEHMARWPTESAFLRSIWPLFEYVSRKEADLSHAMRELRRERERHGVARRSFLNLLVIDAVFGARHRPRHWCAGTSILKPHQPPTDANIYNACADIWMLELAMKSNALFGEYSSAICTQDRGLIAAWALLAPRAFKSSQPIESTHSVECKISLRDGLGERLTGALREELWADLERS